jgi:hypothetical protein
MTEIPISLDQSNKLLNDYSFNNYENFQQCTFDYSSCSNLLFTKDKIEVIYDNHLEIENIEALHPRVMVMSGPCVVNSHNQSKFQDVGYPFTDHITIEPHLESSHNDFNFQEENSIPIYDSDVITQVLILGHDLELFTQVDASVNS